MADFDGRDLEEENNASEYDQMSHQGSNYDEYQQQPGRRPRMEHQFSAPQTVINRKPSAPNMNPQMSFKEYLRHSSSNRESSNEDNRRPVQE